MTNRLDYAPRNILNHMRDGWYLSENDGRFVLLETEGNRRIDVNPRTFRVLWNRQLIMIQMSFNHPTVTRYIMTASGQRAVTP